MLLNYFKDIPMPTLKIPCVANYNIQPYTDPEDAKKAIAYNMSKTAWIQ
jgi:hypothetical protein